MIAVTSLLTPILALAVAVAPSTQSRPVSITAGLDPALNQVCAIPVGASDTDRRARAAAAGFQVWDGFYEREAFDGSIDARPGADECVLEVMLDQGSVATAEVVIGSWAFIHRLTQAADRTENGVGHFERRAPGRGRLTWSVTPSATPDEPAVIHLTWRPRD